jgi:hypothetical protein
MSLHSRPLAAVDEVARSLDENVQRLLDATVARARHSMK